MALSFPGWVTLGQSLSFPQPQCAPAVGASFHSPPEDRRARCRHNGRELRRQGPASALYYANRRTRRVPAGRCTLPKRFGPPCPRLLASPPPAPADRALRTAGSGASPLFFQAGRQGRALADQSSPLLSPSAPRPGRGEPGRTPSPIFPEEASQPRSAPERRPKTTPSVSEESRPLAVSGKSRRGFPPSSTRATPKRPEVFRAAVLPDCWRRPQRHVGCSAG